MREQPHIISESEDEDEDEQEILAEKVKEKEKSSEEDTTSNSCVNHHITLDLLFKEQMKEKTIHLILV